MSIKNIFKTLVVFGGLSVLYPIAEAAEPRSVPAINHPGSGSKFVLKADFNSVKQILNHNVCAIEALSAKLGDCAKKTDLDAYAKKAELAALSARLDDYAKKADLAAYTKTTELQALIDSWNVYAHKDELKAYTKTEDLVSDLGKKKDELQSLIDSWDVYAHKDELGKYAQVETVNQLKTSLDEKMKQDLKAQQDAVDQLATSLKAELGKYAQVETVNQLKTSLDEKMKQDLKAQQDVVDQLATSLKGYATKAELGKYAQVETVNQLKTSLDEKMKQDLAGCAKRGELVEVLKEEADKDGLNELLDSLGYIKAEAANKQLTALQESLEEEKQKNAELEKRIAALEAAINVDGTVVDDELSEMLNRFKTIAEGLRAGDDAQTSGKEGFKAEDIPLVENYLE